MKSKSLIGLAIVVFMLLPSAMFCGNLDKVAYLESASNDGERRVVIDPYFTVLNRMATWRVPSTYLTKPY